VRAHTRASSTSLLNVNLFQWRRQLRKLHRDAWPVERRSAGVSRLHSNRITYTLDTHKSNRTFESALACAHTHTHARGHAYSLPQSNRGGPNSRITGVTQHSLCDNEAKEIQKLSGLIL